MLKFENQLPLNNFKLNLESLSKTLIKKEANETTYYIALISIIYTYFENFINELIQYKNELILKEFPKKIEHFNELENLLYFSSQQENITIFLQNLENHNKKKDWNTFKKCYIDFNQILSPSDKLNRIEFNPFKFNQKTKKLMQNFKIEFGDEIIDKIKLTDYFQDQNPIKSLNIKSFINGSTFYSRYLSNPRSISIHEAKIDENFKNEIISKNKIELWQKSIIDFAEKIQNAAISKITKNK